MLLIGAKWLSDGTDPLTDMPLKVEAEDLALSLVFP